MVSIFGVQAGEARYREGLDLVPDSVINFNDLRAVLGQFGQTGTATGPTTLSGRVFDGLGNPLQKVRVVVEMFTFDQDLGEFVSLGVGTVTDDGSQICWDPGFGIVKSG